MNITALLKKHADRKTMLLIRKSGALADSLGLRAYLVGGTVRDVLMGLRPGRDIDIAVEGDGIMFAKKLADILKGAYKGFEKFRTGKVFLKNGYRLDVASARTEKYRGPAALPDVEFAAINKDLYRRDFTVNAMAVEMNENQFGTLLDPFGGMEAMKKRELCVLHDRSFIDDPTRILRFVRFQSRFDFRADGRTLKLFWQVLQGDVFGNVSGERLREEMVLALSEKNPVKTFENLQKCRVMGKLTPGIEFGSLTRRMFERIGRAADDINSRGIDPVLLMLMALLGFCPDATVRAVLSRLKFSRDWQDKVLQAVKALANIDRLAAEKIKNSVIYSILKGYDIEPLVFIRAVSENAAVRRNVDKYLSGIPRKRLKISGRDLKKLGIKEGPVYSKIMDETMKARLDGKVTSKHQEIQFVIKKFKL